MFWFLKELNSIFSFTECTFAVFSRLFYSGACEGQMPEILSMLQVKMRTSVTHFDNSSCFQIKRMTPAPSVIAVVSESQKKTQRKE